MTRIGDGSICFIQLNSPHFANIYLQGVKTLHNRRFSPYLRCGSIRKKVAQVKGFPTIEEIERAAKEQLARWYRFLPSGETPADQEIMKRIADRFEKLGGMTAELSKKIGM
jgi:hypothetical protein